MPRRLRTRIRIETDPVKGSRFVATAAPVSHEAEAHALLDELRKEWPDASHHCWAWRLASPAIDRAGDDGEPSGSAGRPMLAALTGRELLDTAVIVTRWFGGTKLGVGGLVCAYGGAAAAALDAAVIEEWVAMAEVTFEHSHADTGPVERTLDALEVRDGSIDWDTMVRRSVSLPAAAVDDLWQALGDATSGRISRPHPTD